MGYFLTWYWRTVKFALTIIVGHFKHHFSLPEVYKVELHFFSKYSNGRLYMLRFRDRCETISSNHSENFYVFFLMFQVLHRTVSWKLLNRTWCLHAGDWQSLFSLFLMIWCKKMSELKSLDNHAYVSWYITVSDHNIWRGRNVRCKPLHKHAWVPRYISQSRANIASVTQKKNIESKPLHNRDYVFQYIYHSSL